MKTIVLLLVAAMPLTGCQTSEGDNGDKNTSNSGGKSDRVSCLINAGASSGNRYAALKCSKASDPYNVSINKTVWEKKDKKQYQAMARMSGKRFTCETKASHTKADSGMRTFYVNLTNCR